MTRTSLVCTSSGLSPAHRELIRLLAEIAVADFLDECEAQDNLAHAEDLSGWIN
ncbi:MAG: hypothetical protein MRJ68_02115 [Nitrospira sp.]|nr:hypothetical protein [Nitrospira sp.]